MIQLRFIRKKKIQVDLLELIWNGKAIATKSLKQKSKKKKKPLICLSINL